MAMFSNPITDMRRSRLDSQPFVGTVVANDDTTSKDGKKQHRVRIRVPQLHRNVPDDKLPWTLPQGQGRNAGAGAGTVSVPPVGAKLYYHFNEDDPHNPQYGGSPTSDDVSADNELHRENYPHSDGFVDNAGNRVNFNKEQNTIDVQHVSGTTIHIDANGSVSVSCSDVNIGAEGNINMVAKGEVRIDGSKIKLNGKEATAGTRTARTRPRIADPTNKTKL